MYNDKWNEICFLLSENIKSDISESEFEQNVIRALEALNWREFSGDINIRPSIQVGASGSIIPDFVIKNPEDKDLFVIEIKQPTVPLSTNFQQQLFSYMRLLKLDYGLLIGQVMQLFYDGDLSNRDTPVILDTFEFKRDNPKGNKFVELFLKVNFSLESLEAFTINSLKRINRKAEEKELHKKVLSTVYQTEVVDLIKQDLLKEYDSEIIDNVLQDISLSIVSKNNIKVESPNYHQNAIREINNKPTTRDYTKYSFNGKTNLGKGKFVLEVVREYLRQNPSTFVELKEVFPDSMQRSSLGVVESLDVIQSYDGKRDIRYYLKANEILISSDNVEFAVSRDWGVNNINNIENFANNIGFKFDHE